jgi:hypothetical protein
MNPGGYKPDAPGMDHATLEEIAEWRALNIELVGLWERRKAVSTLIHGASRRKLQLLDKWRYRASKAARVAAE